MLTDEAIEDAAKRYRDRWFGASDTDRQIFSKGARWARAQMVPQWHGQEDDPVKNGSPKRLILIKRYAPLCRYSWLRVEFAENFNPRKIDEPDQAWRELIPGVDYPTEWPAEKSNDFSSQSEREGDGHG